MPLVLVGINHESAPVEVREKLAIGEHALPRALLALSGLGAVLEGAILSTCNRTEIYAVLDPESGATEELLAEFLAGQHGLSRRQFDGRLYFYRDGAAANHLFSVAAGVDSMILGEPDIQRQVKQAMEAAQGAKTLGTLLNRLFQDALVAGKRARTETEIARGAFSIGAAAVERAAQIFGDSLEGNTVLVLGAGKMSEVTARHLQAKGAPTVLVANRTYERAEHLAAQFGGHARRFDELESALLSADIVVCSTSAPHPVVTRTLIKNAMRARHNRPLFLIDIAVPRDVEASVGDLDNVYLYNIDDLMQIVAGARQTRSGEVAQAREIIDAMATEYGRWRQSLEVAPTIVAVRDKLASVRDAELARLRTRLPGLSDKEWRSVEAAMESLTNKIAHPAIVAIKSSATETGDSAALETIRQVFGLEREDDDKLPETMVPATNTRRAPDA
ncbi:MAG: Glutamyl-tRNA reductase [Capsulimonas sp.]|jgi:glutamyl-tRNA reductase|nr:Glutamyl-tRNA reductase [Capsulimonas sp.]